MCSPLLLFFQFVFVRQPFFLPEGQSLAKATKADSSSSSSGSNYPWHLSPEDSREHSRQNDEHTQRQTERRVRAGAGRRRKRAVP